mgnify:CR=1 FL=1
MLQVITDIDYYGIEEDKVKQQGRYQAVIKMAAGPFLFMRFNKKKTGYHNWGIKQIWTIYINPLICWSTLPGFDLQLQSNYDHHTNG